MRTTSRRRRLGDGLVPEKPSQDGEVPKKPPEDGELLEKLPEDGAPLPPERGDVDETSILSVIINTTSSRGAETPEEDAELNKLREQLRRKRKENEKTAIRVKLVGEEPSQRFYASINDIIILMRGYKRVVLTYVKRLR